MHDQIVFNQKFSVRRNICIWKGRAYYLSSIKMTFHPRASPRIVIA